jgi:hypothetical protein
MLLQVVVKISVLVHSRFALSRGVWLNHILTYSQPMYNPFFLFRRLTKKTKTDIMSYRSNTLSRGWIWDGKQQQIKARPHGRRGAVLPGAGL